MRLFTYKTGADDTRFVVRGKVKHSQRMSATPLLPWFVAEKRGEILAAHCTCMAGLGEACSHIAALLSSVMKANQLRNVPGKDSCTSKSCAWLPANRNVVAAQVEDIKFVKPSSSSKRQKVCQPPQTCIIAPPTEEELAEFHASLSMAPSRPVIHRVMDEFAHEFIPMAASEKYPPAMSSLYDPDSLGLTYPELLTKCSELADSLKVASEQCVAVEKSTREQAANKLWFTQRAGRITASIFKSAARTNPAMPSASLVKRVCYPEAFRFSTEATRWGCDHEKIAREALLEQERPQHNDLSARDCGLRISEELPFIGVSPDAILECTCCGERVLEVKCPFCVKDGLPANGEIGKRDFCMNNDDGEWHLKRNHAYYYQVQAQLNVWNIEKGVFVLWTEKEFVIDYIQRDIHFFNEQVKSVKQFFVTGILPELVGKWLCRKPVESSSGGVRIPEAMPTVERSEDEEDRVWCYCEKPSYGDMIGCDGKNCKIQWFHMDCLMIRVPPKGKWYCPHCRKQSKNGGKKKLKSK